MSKEVDESLTDPLSLTAQQKQFLKGAAHALSPLVQIGKDGLSSGVMESIKNELLHHELIKVKIGNNSGLEKKEASAEIAKKSGAAMVQLIGKTIVLYKKNPKRAKEKRIKLPSR